MQTLTENIINSPLKNRIFSDGQLKRLLDGSDQRRYGLVNRALASGEILRICRGVYVLNNRLRDRPCHRFTIAQSLVPLSYVSFETALQWHGWIPEAVPMTASVVPGRKKSQLEHPVFGSFSFSPLALAKNNYLCRVIRTEIDQQVFLLADPLRALFDLVCQRKTEWSGRDFFSHGLRIDVNLFDTLNRQQCEELREVYQHQRVRHFIDSFATEFCNG